MSLIHLCIYYIEYVCQSTHHSTLYLSFLIYVANLKNECGAQGKGRGGEVQNYTNENIYIVACLAIVCFNWSILGDTVG